MVDFHQRQIIYFSETMLTVASNHWRLYAFCLLTRSNIQRISSYFEEIMNVPQSTAFMDSTMNVRGNLY